MTSLEIVHADEETPGKLTKSIFLAGPLPRQQSVPDWRQDAVSELEAAGYRGTVFIPTHRDGRFPDDDLSQIVWKQKHLCLADVVAVWCPRDLERLPGFTTNIEFGELLESRKLIYGRPDSAPKTAYMDARYRDVNRNRKAPFAEPCNSLRQLAEVCTAYLGDGAPRQGGERFVPLAVWNSKQFQAWYHDLVAAGNRLDDARILWKFHIPQANDFLLCFSLWVKVWIQTEQRFKENEFIISRSDLAHVCAFWPDPERNDLLKTKVVLVREFRSPGRNQDGFIHELPGGSSFGLDQARQVAAKEFKAETGIEIESSRLHEVVNRQISGVFSTHKAQLFSVELTSDEVQYAELLEAEQVSFGVSAEAEKTFVEVRTLRQIMNEELLDHATVGMVLQACLMGKRILTGLPLTNQSDQSLEN
jgi:ADP-ribose pyrophosphatase YjhB (NUDIX family)